MIYTMILPTMITILSIYASLSSSNPIMMWFFMEISSMSFIVLATSFKNSKKEIMVVYFLSQATASIMLLMAMVSKTTQQNGSVMASMAVLIKNGIFPMCNWFILTVKNSNWQVVLMMISTQKIIPLNMIPVFNIKNFFTLSTTILSMVWSALMMMQQKKMTMIVSLGSINSTSVFMFMYMYQNKMANTALLLYTIMMTMTFLMWKKTGLDSMSTMSQNPQQNNLNMMVFMFSVSGMPPFLMFYVKVTTLNSILLENNKLMFTVAMMAMVVSTYSFLMTMMKFLKAHTLMIFKNKTQWLTGSLITLTPGYILYKSN